MRISLQNIGKKYNREWIFRRIDYQFSSSEAYAILGSNGSGKSTLLQVLSGRIHQSEGALVYHDLHGKEIPIEEVFRYISFASPYQELIEEFTISEMLGLHGRLKPLIGKITDREFIGILGLGHAARKPIRCFSSGMKQRVKLALAILSDVPTVLLDEPCSNLDRQGMDWYRQLVSDHHNGRLFIICSNHQDEEISFCTQRLNVNDYKV